MTKPLPLPPGPELLAGINSFGFGGTNAHAILASAPATAASKPRAVQPLPPLLLSARAPGALTGLAQDWSRLLAASNAHEAAALLNAQARRRDHHRHRLHLRAETPAQMAEALGAFSSGERPAGLASGTAVGSGKIAFVYSGNGSQFLGMARDALDHSETFRVQLARVDSHLAKLLDWSVAARLLDDDPTALVRTDIAQPLLFAVQVAITAALADAGLQPDLCFGHSVGEIAAAWAAGALSLDSACRIVAARSHQQQRTQGAGGMAALSLDEAAWDEVTRIDPRLEIAAHNSRSAITVAGPRDALARLEAEAVVRGWRYTGLDLDYAFHSSALDPIHADLLTELGKVKTRDCGNRFISTVSGDAMAGSALDASYWWRNIREPVRFREGTARAVADGARILIEIGPNPILQSYLRDGLKAADADGAVLSSLSRQARDSDPFEAIAANGYVAGCDLSGHAAFDGPTNVAQLPRYPFQREHFWYPETTDGTQFVLPRQDHPLLGFRAQGDGREWTQNLDLALQPWLADHAVEGVAILPAAAIVEIALAVARQVQDGAGLRLAEVDIVQALALEEGRGRSLRVRLNGEGGITIESRQRLGDESWTLHATARLAPDDSGAAPSVSGDMAVVETITAETLYARAAALGLDYGPQFRCVQRVERLADGSARALFAPAPGFESCFIAPPLFDGGLQAFLALLSEAAARSDHSLLPWRFTGLKLFAPLGRVAVEARLNVTHRGVRAARGRMTLVDNRGVAVAEIAECWFRQVRLTRAQNLNDRAFHFEVVAMPHPQDDAAPLMDEIALAQACVQPGAAGDTALLLEGYVAAAARLALLQVVPVGQPFAVSDLVRRGSLVADAAPLAASLLGLLANHGAATAHPWQWQLPRESDLPAPEDIWRTLLDENPALTAELALAAAAAEALPEFLRHGHAAALPPALLEQFLRASPDGRAAAETLRRAVLQLAARWPQGRPLRVLDVGGGAARMVLDALSGWGGSLRYVATDASPEVAGRLAARLAGHADASALAWNPQTDDVAMLGTRFDIVLSSPSRRGLDDAALATLQRALAPGGLLLATAPLPNALWTWVFGQQADWWRAEVQPLDSENAWQQRLASQGFEDIATYRLAETAWPAALMVARRATFELPQAMAPSQSTMLIVAEKDDAIAAALAARLAQTGIAANVIVPPEVGDGQDYTAALGALADGGLDVIALPQTTGDRDAVSATNLRLMRVLTVARLTAANHEKARLWIVTRDAQGAVAGVAEEAALWGLGRTIANEMPGLDCRLLDLSSALEADDAAVMLADELVTPGEEREVLLTPQGRSVLRLRRGAGRAAPVQGPVKLAAITPGRLDGLDWQPQTLAAPGPGEVAIIVRAADVNFRDVMWALDLLPEEALMGGYGGPSLGLACAGVVRAVGQGVTHLAPGDAVLATAPETFASDVIARVHTVTRLPEGLDFAAAAALPVAFITVLYALGHLANLKAGESVLIHGGAGGVGLAAIQYAHAKGAHVIATAGSPAKRAFLRHMGADHVLDSRGLGFADGVRALTGGEGVDVVLNSLNGDAMELSLGLVKPFGRFLELGKRDFFTGTRIGLKPMRRNVSYFAVDVDALPVARPDLSRALMEELTAMLAQGLLRPLPYRLFRRAEVGDAFRLMQAAGHIGKIVLSMDAEDSLAEPMTAPAFEINSDGTYLVTGGLDGFGLATAQWLASHGARALALVGRRGLKTPGAEQAIAALAAQGVEARAFACDVADETALAATLDDIRSSMPPLTGVVHAAMTLDDGLLDTLDSARYAKVLTPKLGGALALDLLTRNDPISLFLLYSSATTVLGAPGQGSYVTANFAMEGVARRRRAASLPAFVVGWGPIADAGYLARNVEARDMLARRLAAQPMPAAEALDALPALIAGGEVSVAYAQVRWETAHRMLPVLSAPTFAGVAGAPQEAGESELRDRLATLPPEECKAALLGVLTQEVARILSCAADGIDPNRPVAELGMDSLMAVEMRLGLEARIGVNLPMFSLSPQTSLTMIAARIARDLATPGAPMDDVAMTAQRYEVEEAAPALADQALAGDGVTIAANA